MGIDYYSCEICGEAFPDVIHYGHCGKCEATLCGHCYDAMREKNGEIGEDHENADSYGEDSPNCCDLCDGSVVEMKLSTNAALEYLDDCIESWRKERDYDGKNKDIAQYYIDAFQSVRVSLFGELKD